MRICIAQLALTCLLSLALYSQPVTDISPAEPLSLDQAVSRALEQHPQLASAAFLAEASKTVVKQTRAAYSPLLNVNATGVEASNQTQIAAGTLQAQGLASRFATGFGVSQLVTDFGRTSKLTDAARLRAELATESIQTKRLEVVLGVKRAYYAAQGANAVLTVAKATLQSRQVILRQVQRLTENQLRSTLDQSFAEVSVSEAELLVQEAENSLTEAFAALAAAMGSTETKRYVLETSPTLPELQPDVQALINEAIERRPELKIARLKQSAEQKSAEAERRGRYPTIRLEGTAGIVPIHAHSLRDHYAAVGVNVSLPFLNGGIYAARAAEADLKAKSTGKDAEHTAIQLTLAVKTTWLQADTARRRVVVAEKMVQQTQLAHRLAKTRYESGLGGILEVTQAQLAETSAQIAFANARFDYLSQIANLNFAMGNLQ